MMLRLFRHKRRLVKITLVAVIICLIISICFKIINSFTRKERSILSEDLKRQDVHLLKVLKLPIKKMFREKPSLPIGERVIQEENTKMVSVAINTSKISMLTTPMTIEERKDTKELIVIFGNFTACLKETFDKFYWRPANQTFMEVEKEIRNTCLQRLFGAKSNYCVWPAKKLVGPLLVDMKPPKMYDLVKDLDFVQSGGYWKPSFCTPKHEVAIVIPFKDRMEHLLILLHQLHRMLKRQELSYRILVIEQVDEYPFNRGKLMNVGYKEALKISPFTCFVFHDVDLIPENDLNYYGCPESPRHLSTAIDKFNYVLPYPEIFGGVEMFTKTDFETVNGFPNTYWGWGGEDDNLYKRISRHSLSLSRPTMAQGRYRMIKHAENDDKPPNRHDKLNNAHAEFDTDGISSLHYIVLQTLSESLYTHLKVDLDMEGDMIF